MEKVAVYTGSRNIYNDMVVCAKSLIACSDVDKIYFLIEDDEFPFNLPKDIIETRNVSNQQYFKPSGPNSRSRFTYFAMMRAAMATEFPEYDKILSLDCDTLCVRDISHLWELPIDDYYFAASSEPHRCVGGLLYTNVGVCLQNLKMLRDNGKSEECVEVLNRRRYTWVDQDVMNYLCQGYIYDMNSEYNANDWTIPARNPRIIHFAGVKSDIWHSHEKFKEYNSIDWTEVMRRRKMNKEYPM